MSKMLSHTLRKFNRFELKYVITLQQAEQFKRSLRAYMIHDEHGNENGRYALSSLYYDSPGLRCYWEKENGIRYRRKLRLRRYETGEVLTEETAVFLEIKQRVDRVTQKRRAILPYGAALRLCNDRQLPDDIPDKKDRRVIEEIFVFVWQYNLLPMSIVRYEREAFIGTEYDPGLRVTFDTDLSFQAHTLHLHERPSSVLMLAPNLVVMEIKVNERIPRWLTEIIAANNLNITRVSKYCRSIDAAQNMTLPAQRIPLAESAQETLASSFSLFTPLPKQVKSKRS